MCTRRMKVKTGVRAGLAGANHSPTRLRVKTGVRAGLGGTNHNQTARR